VCAGHGGGPTLEVGCWRLEHTEQIIELGPQPILAEATPDDVARGIAARIIQVTETFVNSDRLETSGVDAAAIFGWETASVGRLRRALSCARLEDYVLSDGTLGAARTWVDFAGRRDDDGRCARARPVPARPIAPPASARSRGRRRARRRPR
jgi:hypothetical protein